jgi:hypothetical protein
MLPDGGWADVGFQRDFVQCVEMKLGISKRTDWYKFNGEDVNKNGGTALLNLYHGSLEKCT